jgi:hypothetical protein
MWKSRNNYAKNEDLEKPQYLFSVDNKKISTTDSKIIEDQQRELQQHLDKLKDLQNIISKR